VSEEYLTEIVEDLLPTSPSVSIHLLEGRNLRIDVNKDTLPDMWPI